MPTERPCRSRFATRGRDERFRGSLAAAFLAILAISPVPPAARAGEPPLSGWSRISSVNFAVVTDDDATRVEPLLLELEVFRATISRYLGLPGEQRKQVTVYLLADQNQWDAFRPPSESRTKGLSGYQASDGFDQVLIARVGDDLVRARAVLFHEYTHLLTSRMFRQVPIWLNEGLADVFSDFTVTNRQFRFGGPLNHRVGSLLRDGLLPCAELVAVQHESAAYQHGSEVPRFYASAWLLSHVLTLSRNGFNATGIRNYIAFSGSRTNRLDAFRLAFGLTPQEADALAFRVLHDGTLAVVSAPFDGALVPPHRIESLSNGEISLKLGELARLVQLNPKASALLEAARVDLPADPRPCEQLAILADTVGNTAEARRLVEQALSLGSHSSHAHFLAASVRWKALAGQAMTPKAFAAERAEVLRLIDRAIQLDPWQPRCHALRAIILLEPATDNPREAEASARRALQLDTFYYPARLALAEALAASGQLGEASRAVAGLLASPLDDELREAVVKFSTRLNLRLQAPPGPAGTGPR